MAWDRDGNWVDDPNEVYTGPKSPYEKAHEAGNGDDFDRAVAANYGPDGTQYDGGDHDPIDWFNPDTYNYLVNEPDPTSPTAPGGRRTPLPTGQPFSHTMPAGKFGFTLPDLPRFNAPNLPDVGTFKRPDPFVAPSPDTIYQDPTYQLRKSAGEGALINDAAASGLRRSGGSLKDLLAYNQNFAATDYKGYYERAAGEYDRTYKQLLDEFSTNRDTKFGTYDRELNAAGIGYGGELEGYRTTASAAQRSAELQWQREWEAYQQTRREYDADQDRILRTYEYEKSLV